MCYSEQPGEPARESKVLRQTEVLTFPILPGFLGVLLEDRAVGGPDASRWRRSLSQVADRRTGRTEFSPTGSQETALRQEILADASAEGPARQ